MSDLPPLYTTASLPSLPTNPNLPQYTQSPSEHERVLSSEPASPVIFDVTRQGVYKTDHLEIDLGQFPSTLAHPAYGYNGVVEGKVRFTKACSYVTQVTVKLEGIMTLTASEYARVAVPSVTRVTLVSHTVTLFSGSQGASEGYQGIRAGTEHSFAIPFPSYITGQNAPLPPSFTAVQPGAYTEVTYFIQVEVMRKGILRRHELRKIPILYLPKSRPPAPSMEELPLLTLDPIPERTKAIELRRTWPNTCQSRALSSTDLPIVHLFLPHPRCYPSGEFIPLGIMIGCPSSPAVTKLYTSDITVQLLKRRKLIVGATNMVNIHDTVLSTGRFDRKNDCSRGQSCLLWKIEAGASGRETSWSIDGVIEVLYILRVEVRPLQRHLPVYKHEETVQVTTDSYDALDIESLGGLSEPAIGLTALRPAGIVAN